MYQSIYWDYREKLCYLRDDKAGWKKFPFKPTFYKIDPNGKYKTLDGLRASPTQYCDWNKPLEYYEIDIPMETRILLHLYQESDERPEQHNVIFFDIECEIAGALTPELIKNAPTKITSIALYDNTTQIKYCLILDEKNKLNNLSQEGVEIIIGKTEKELLHKFLNLWEELDPTIITGWNSGYFDVPYLYNRLVKVLGSNEALRLSPIKKIKETEWDLEQPVVIGGVNHLDYLLLHKKYTPKQEPSYKLNNIGLKYVNLGKIEYEGNLDKLFKEDPKKFIEYNIRDVDIIIELDKKLQYIDLTINICHLCHVNYENIYYSTALNEGAILTYLKRKDIVSPNKPTTINPNLKGLKESYAGGYLKDPVPGLYEWVSDLDFTSLYPSIIRNLNIGLETLMGRIKNRGKYDNKWGLNYLKEMDPDEQITLEKITKNRQVQATSVSVKDLLAVIKEANLTLSANGTLFRKNKSSIVVEIMNDWFDKRKEYKNKMKEAYKKGNTELGEFYNKRQHAYKIKLNDVYGCYAINSWRYSDGNKFISAAITLTGQFLTQQSIDFVNKDINKQLGTNRDYVITGDTDSLFFELKDLILKDNPNIDLNNRQQATEAALKITKDYQDKTVSFLQQLSKDYFNCDNEYFELKQEVVLERGYFAGKRRYAQFIVNKEGVPTEELDMKGLDIMKSNMTPLYSQFGYNLLMDIMYGKPKEHIDKQIINFKKSLKNHPYRKLARPTGVKKIKEYIDSPPRSGEIFSKLKTKCPINTKAAIYTNDLLRFKGLDNDYPCFVEGDKMYYIPLKDNPYKIEVLGFTGNDPEYLKDFLTKYADIEKGFNTILLNKLKGIYEDLKWDFPSFNSRITKFFTYG